MARLCSDVAPVERSAIQACRFAHGRAQLAMLLALTAVTGCGGGGGSDGPPEPPGDVTPPTMPLDLFASLSSPNTIGLSWSASEDDSGVAGYKVYRNNAYLDSVTGTTATDAGLAWMTLYSYQVSAFDAAGNESPLSAPVYLSTGDGAAPSTPADLVVSASAPGQLDLSWSAATDNVGVTGYNVYRTGALVANVSATSTVITDLGPATRHCFTVSAVDAGGNESDQSAPVCGTTLWAVATIACEPYPYTLGFANAIAVDSQGKVHVAFVGGNSALEYASNESGSWLWTLVRQGTTEGVASVAIALDANDKAHLSYYSVVDFTTETKDLKYATNAAGDWSDTTIDGAGDVGRPSSIAAGTGNQVHISYFDATNRRVKHAAWDGGWAVTTIDSGGPDNQIRVAPNGDVHVVYGSNVYPYPLKHSLIHGGTTTISSIGSVVGGGGLIAFDQAGQVYVAYRIGYVMSYATLVDGAWIAASAGIDSIAEEMVVDGDGKIHFYAVSNYYPAEHPEGLLALLHDTDASGAWTEQISVIDRETEGSAHSLAVEPGGKVHVVYRNSVGTCLKYATDR